MPTYTNPLIHETSPYLLQHAHNPVYWQAWSPAVLRQAQKEDKPLLISIGYAACHWCHVMETVCFKNEQVAELMNKNFINIKVDREERPDLDQIYMDALQMLSGSGGWPLTIVALPDGKPFWGATYMPKDKWIHSLQQLVTLYRSDNTRVRHYAEQLSQGLKAIALVENHPPEQNYSLEQLEDAVTKWSRHFDTSYGGYQHTPKFMMPTHWNFLLHYATATHKPDLLKQVNTTLTRMAWGGLYDHVGGGFCRYAVDAQWHVPHFEKMLYDNAQLISLYAKAYVATKNELYKTVVEQTIAFVKEALLADSGGFFAALDADSQNAAGESEEGAYYSWTKEELEKLLKEDFAIFRDYYNINAYGHWKGDAYLLIRNKSEKEIAEKYKISVSLLREKIVTALKILKAERAKRSGPRRDDKLLLFSAYIKGWIWGKDLLYAL